MAILNKEDLPILKLAIDLTGPDGSAFVLLGLAKSFCKQLGIEYEPIRLCMLSGDYENLVKVFDKEFGEYVDLIR